MTLGAAGDAQTAPSRFVAVFEHPEVISERIVRLASVVGRENVIPGTDCGLGGRVHDEIAWAKFAAMAEGAALATKELWGR